MTTSFPLHPNLAICTFPFDLLGRFDLCLLLVRFKRFLLFEDLHHKFKAMIFQPKDNARNGNIALN